jgi:hypothetical protein
LDRIKNPLVVDVPLPSGGKSADFMMAAVVDRGSDLSRSRHKFKLVTNPSISTPTLRAKVDVQNGRAVSLRLTCLGYEVDGIDEWLPLATRENDRIAAFNFFDNNLEKIKSIMEDPKAYFDPTKWKSDYAIIFEEAVGWLLCLAGFQTIHEGTPDYKLSTTDEIDWLAFVPKSKRLLAVEVTTAPPLHKDKLATLRERTDHLKRVMNAYEILPVLVTAKPELYEGYTIQADGLGVVIANPAVLTEILELASENADPNLVFDMLSEHLPKREPTLEQ